MFIYDLKTYVERELPVSKEVAYNIYLEDHYKKGLALPGMEMIEKGDEDGLGYHAKSRTVEKIVKAERPNEVHYTYVSGFLPFKEHLGEVMFEEISESKCKIKYLVTGKTYLGCVTYLQGFLDEGIPRLVNAFEKRAKELQSSL
eukprot:maker-scaffold_4-snap-gene-12.5-mRNA-1 protein AED:0.28 eAED:0.28 QI:68/0.5/0.66/1/0.5/0.33/3/147/143